MAVRDDVDDGSSSSSSRPLLPTSFSCTCFQGGRIREAEGVELKDKSVKAVEKEMFRMNRLVGGGGGRAAKIVKPV